MIANEEPVIANSLWSATARPSEPCAELQGDVSADVAIVGAGFTGLSAALHLAQMGRSVVVLEAQTPGWGASGRNGGQVNPGLIAPPNDAIARFGPEMGLRMIRLSGEAGQLVFDLIAQHKIQCDARPVGWLRAAHNRGGMTSLAQKAEQWAQHGAELTLLSQTEVAQAIGTKAYIGGLIDPRGGNLHPLNYAWAYVRPPELLGCGSLGARGSKNCNAAVKSICWLRKAGSCALGGCCCAPTATVVLYIGACNNRWCRSDRYKWQQSRSQKSCATISCRDAMHLLIPAGSCPIFGWMRPGVL